MQMSSSHSTPKQVIIVYYERSILNSNIKSNISVRITFKSQSVNVLF